MAVNSNRAVCLGVSFAPIALRAYDAITPNAEKQMAISALKLVEITSIILDSWIIFYVLVL